MQPEKKKTLSIMWWNVCNFYHYKAEEAGKGGKSRWPKTQQDYEEKCRRVDQALSDITQTLGKCDVIFLCEITLVAATELRDRLFPEYDLISLDVKKDNPTLQIAVLHIKSDGVISITEQMPLIAEDTARNSRPMAVLDVKVKKKNIRIIACHWPSRMDEEGSEDQRYDNATCLGKYSYDFISKDAENNNVVIVGDLNEEPHERSLRRLNAHRHRGRALGKSHWADGDVKRLHLYNTSWRLLGEKHAHPSRGGTPALDHSAGTYYWEEERAWRNFDQLIVSGGLLGEKEPFINEHETLIVSLPAFLTNGLPLKFKNKEGTYSGVSDHLPLFTIIHI